MTFNSLAYLVLLPATVLAFFALPARGRIPLLIGASVVFYSFWSVPFVGLILLSALIDFVAGLCIQRYDDQPRIRRLFLLLSILANLAILGYFKYSNFFLENIAAMLGSNVEVRYLYLLLPPGISFYTFQSMSYTIDVYRRQITPTRSFARFFLYVSFFPQLVAGPIERAAHLLTQFDQVIHHRFSSINLVVGSRMILWGLFKKVMIADYCGLIVEAYYSDPTAHSGASAWVATYAFYLQIYCDFSAYSEIARGSARLFGIDLMKNFDQPLLSTSIADFWRRWHISLSTWFRDYVYIPLGGNQRRLHRVMFNLFLTAAISGLWHGAAWNFVLWGCYHGVLLVVTALVLRTRWYGALSQRLGKTEQFLGFLLQFHLSIIGFFIFCSGSLADMGHTLRAATQAVVGGMQLTAGQGAFVGFLVLFLALSWVCRRLPVFETIHRNTSLSVLFYAVLIVIMLLYGNMNEQPFFYFQF